MVFEYREEQQKMVLMNYWNRDGSRVEQQVFPQSVAVFREAEVGRFVSTPTEDILTEVPQLGRRNLMELPLKLWKCKV